MKPWGKAFFPRTSTFNKRPLGEDLHLTYRIPAWEGRQDTPLRPRLHECILSLADLARELELPRPPVTEMFLPMTTSASQPIGACHAFRETADYHRMVFHDPKADEQRLLDLFTVTPLVEDVDSLFSIETIIDPYWTSLQKESTLRHRAWPARLPCTVRSRDELRPGPRRPRHPRRPLHPPSIGRATRPPVHPVIGTGSLPFRGSVRPGNTDVFLRQYAGTGTYSIQSAFRYDYPQEDVRAALQTMQREVPRSTSNATLR
jgi:phosphoenolpyruvate carboxylase